MKKLVLFLALIISNIGSFCYAADGSINDGLDGSFVWACYDLELVYARGSGGEYETTAEYQAVAEAADKIRGEFGLSVYSHDLNYPAVGVSSPKRLLGAYVSAGKSYEFGDSVRIGVSNLKAHYEEQHRNCPDMHFALIGYSQGAMVVTQAIESMDARYVDFVMLLGDPNTYLPEGEGLYPAACRDGTASSWRSFVPNCWTRKGVFGARMPYEVKGFEGKYALWCNREDYICGSSQSPLYNSEHTTYASSGEIVDGLLSLARKFLKKNEAETENPLHALFLRKKAVESVEKKLAAPDDVLVWRDGDVIKMWWRAPEEAKDLLVRFNGYDLGYVDAKNGALEIRDVNFSDEYSLLLAWMDDGGKLGEERELASSEITMDEPEIVAQDDENADDVLVVEDIIMNSSEDEPSIDNLPSMLAATPSRSGTAAIFSPVVSSVVSGFDSALPDVVAGSRTSQSRPAEIKSSRLSGLNFAQKSDIANIIVGIAGASGLLLLFITKRRRGV